MRRLSLFALFLVILVTTTQAFPQTESPGEGRGRRQKGRLLKRADTNGDGQISRDEWTRKPRGCDRLDRNHDGAITGDEAKAAAHERIERRKKALERMDKDNDGQIAREEWPGNPEAFDRRDRNKDGVISRDEMGRRRFHRRPQREP